MRNLWRHHLILAVPLHRLQFENHILRFLQIILKLGNTLQSHSESVLLHLILRFDWTHCIWPLRIICFVHFHDAAAVGQFFLDGTRCCDILLCLCCLVICWLCCHSSWETLLLEPVGLYVKEVRTCKFVIIVAQIRWRKKQIFAGKIHNSASSIMCLQKRLVIWIMAFYGLYVAATSQLGIDLVLPGIHMYLFLKRKNKGAMPCLLFFYTDKLYQFLPFTIVIPDFIIAKKRWLSFNFVHMAQVQISGLRWWWCAQLVIWYSLPITQLGLVFILIVLMFFIVVFHVFTTLKQKIITIINELS